MSHHMICRKATNSKSLDMVENVLWRVLTALLRLALALGLPHEPTTAIHITDLQPMLQLMKHNISINESSLRSLVTPSVYSWGSSPPAHLPVPPDVVLAADCVYFEPAFPLLMQTLRDLISEQTICWFCFKRRRRADISFAKDLRKGFEVLEIEPADGEDDWRRENLHL